MRPEPKKRIDTGAPRAPLGGFGNALAGLELSPMPSEPPVSPKAETGPVWKMGRVILRRERAHRGGKTVIVVDDFAAHLPPAVIDAIASKIRTACGCGGTVKERRIEVQGDQPAKIRAVLEAEGLQVAGVR